MLAQIADLRLCALMVALMSGFETKRTKLCTFYASTTVVCREILRLCKILVSLLVCKVLASVSYRMPSSTSNWTTLVWAYKL